MSHCKRRLLACLALCFYAIVRVNFDFVVERFAIGAQNSRHLFIQSEVKPKPKMTRLRTFSCALRQLHVFPFIEFDWFDHWIVLMWI